MEINVSEELRKQSLDMTLKLHKDLESLSNMDKSTAAEMLFEYYKKYKETFSNFLDSVRAIQNVSPAMFDMLDIALICTTSDKFVEQSGNPPDVALVGRPDNVAKLIIHLLNAAPELKAAIKEYLNG